MYQSHVALDINKVSLCKSCDSTNNDSQLNLVVSLSHLSGPHESNTIELNSAPPVICNDCKEK